MAKRVSKEIKAEILGKIKAGQHVVELGRGIYAKTPKRTDPGAPPKPEDRMPPKPTIPK